MKLMTWGFLEDLHPNLIDVRSAERPRDRLVASYELKLTIELPVEIAEAMVRSRVSAFNVMVEVPE